VLREKCRIISGVLKYRLYDGHIAAGFVSQTSQLNLAVFFG
jgi:hypothetical protein